MRFLSGIVGCIALLSGAPATAQLGDAVPDFVALADAEGDGVLSQDEFTAYYALIWEILAAGKPEVEVEKANPILRAAVMSAMPEATGIVGRDELLLDAVPTRYRIADRNKDGVVTMTEMRAWKSSAMTPPKN